MNPYEASSAQISATTSVSIFSVGLVASVLSLGPMLGVVSLFVLTPIFILPFWHPPIYKGDERWKTIFFLATTGLPISMLAGVVVAGIWLSLKRTSLPVGQNALCWFICIALIPSFRPVVDRIRRPGNTPRYEWIPDTLWYFAIGCFVIALAVIVTRKSAR
jgi:hypothetical protein